MKLIALLIGAAVIQSALGAALTKEAKIEKPLQPSSQASMIKRNHLAGLRKDGIRKPIPEVDAVKRAPVHRTHEVSEKPLPRQERYVAYQHDLPEKQLRDKRLLHKQVLSRDTRSLLKYQRDLPMMRREEQLHYKRQLPEKSGLVKPQHDLPVKQLPRNKRAVLKYERDLPMMRREKRRYYKRQLPDKDVSVDKPLPRKRSPLLKNEIDDKPLPHNKMGNIKQADLAPQ